MSEPTDLEKDLDLPPKPEPPADGECCESGCDPCVYDYYYEALERWRQEVAAIQARRAGATDQDSHD